MKVPRICSLDEWSDKEYEEQLLPRNVVVVVAVFLLLLLRAIKRLNLFD